MSLLPAIEIETKGQPDASIIWLHGLGADGHDFVPIVEQLNLPRTAAVRFIFPHAPSMPVTVNGGFIMPAWYDIYEMQIDRKVDFAGIKKSAASVAGFIDRELQRGIDGKRIIIAGFSQGGVIAYHLVLDSAIALAGLLAMSTYLATADILTYEETNKKIPVMIHHGLYDPVVPETLGRNAADTLRQKGYLVEYQTYPMEHAVCPKQIKDISDWIKKLLLL